MLSGEIEDAFLIFRAKLMNLAENHSAYIPKKLIKRF
jgi:hypothetical protein